METDPGGTSFDLRSSRSQPTYKGWKRATWRAMGWKRRAFPAYLQGMETLACLRSHLGQGRSQPTYKGWKLEVARVTEMQFMRSQPTYKGWKPNLTLRNFLAMFLFPAYLQGMETAVAWAGRPCPAPFPAYLQGMETAGILGGFARYFDTFPAYLQGMETISLIVRIPVRTRFPAYLQGMETDHQGAGEPGFTRSQPTYKEWKPVIPS